jgi:hypothetical protein
MCCRGVTAFRASGVGSSSLASSSMTSNSIPRWPRPRRDFLRGLRIVPGTPTGAELAIEGSAKAADPIATIAACPARISPL